MEKSVKLTARVRLTRAEAMRICIAMQEGIVAMESRDAVTDPKGKRFMRGLIKTQRRMMQILNLLDQDIE